MWRHGGKSTSGDPPVPKVYNAYAMTDFDVPRFTAWLGDVTDEPADVTVTPIRGGGSCEMFRVDRLGESSGCGSMPDRRKFWAAAKPQSVD